MSSVAEAAQQIHLALVRSRQLTTVADASHVSSAGFSWTRRDRFTGNMRNVLWLFRIRDVDDRRSIIFLLPRQRIHLRPAMMANVGKPTAPLLMDGWLIGTPGLQIVIAHQFHIVLLRFLLCGFSNRQQHKTRNRKAGFHKTRLLRRVKFWNVLRASYQKLSLHSPICSTFCSKSMEDGCQSLYQWTPPEFAAHYRKTRKSAAEF